MSREEIITKIKDMLSEVYQLTDNDTLNENIKKVFNDVEQLRQPITLADFLGWEEGVEYEFAGKVYKTQNNTLYERVVNSINSFLPAHIVVNNTIISKLKQAEKVEEKKYYAKIKGWELLGSDICCFYQASDKNIYLTSKKYADYLIKSEWNKLGINDTNADFEEV